MVGVWSQSLVEVSLWIRNSRSIFLVETDLKIFKVLRQIAGKWLSYREFAEMVVMSDVWCGFLPKEKPYWCNKDIRFGARCLVWHSILHSRFFFHLISSHPILLFKLRRQNTPRDGKKCSKLWRLELLEVTYEILFSNLHGAKEIVWMKEILESWQVEL